ncbi:helix-turn-helix domain-containing protein [Nocardiopsis suaedae]|uniref:Helix-turn-helix transcriptional regulator n=1 Tax=Nocardiopsis suaedae TaxID=3018444 RepID=A0ABT4TWB0_9ACTN|nr:helix-turn-helix transcriptional regulator [Nocardiopsis suaedae]MDA2808988.1 helix-turn-helix transcriptional regulator [Nocardiopsis suaedae]
MSDPTVSAFNDLARAHPHRGQSGIGARIARVRKRRGLTQEGLAARCHYSRPHIAQVERGHKVATPAFVSSVARALAIDPSELYGQPFRDSARDEKVHAPINEIRRALAFVEVPPDLEAPPRSLDRLDAELATCKRLRRSAQHVKLGARLPALIEELTYHVYEDDLPRAWRLLFNAQDTAGELVRRLGYNDLTNQLLERSAVAAEKAGDPHLPLMVARRRALLMAGVAAYSPALRLVRRSLDRVDPGHPTAAEATGSLHLRAAVIAARGNEPSAAWDHFEQARTASQRAGARRLDAYGTNFVPGNVAIHGAAVAVELGDVDEAVRRDDDIGERLLSSVSPERRAHHAIDMARAHVDAADRDKALDRLLYAERTAPQMTRYHPMAQAVATHLAGAYRDLPDRLRQLLARMAIT